MNTHAALPRETLFDRVPPLFALKMWWLWSHRLKTGKWEKPKC